MIKNRHCVRVNVADLVNEEIRMLLKFFQGNDDFNEDDIIWQQMTCENFRNFLDKGALCFKQLWEYDRNDERKLDFYKQNYLRNIKEKKKRDIIKKRNSDFEKIVYISCWYHMDFLTDLVFKEYASADGVAIGIRIKDLIQAIESYDGQLKDYEEVYYGKTAYLEKKYKIVTDCEEAIAPLFLKDTSKFNDSEFRLAYVRDSLWSADINGMKLIKKPEKLCFLDIGRAEDIIQYIAVKSESTSFHDVIEKYKLNIIKSKRKIDNFKVFEVK